MKIVDVCAWPVRIDHDEVYLGPKSSGDGESTPSEAKRNAYFLRPPYESLYSSYFEAFFVRIETDSGVVGWGEALAPVGPEILREIVSKLLGPLLVGRNPLETHRLFDEMYGTMRERGHWSGFMQDAIAACDIALWDLKGKLLDQPVAVLLGGRRRGELPVYVSGLPRKERSERVQLAREWVEKGFRRIKLHAGWGVDEDLEEANALRQALGPQVEILWDAHWRYDRPQALRLARGLADLHVGLLETPLAPEHYGEYAALRRESPVPIALGEAERTSFAFRDAVLAGAVDILQPDIGRTGLTEGARIVELARVFGRRVAPHLSTGLGVCIAATLHLASACPNLHLVEYQPVTSEVAGLYLREPLVCERGAFILPQGPGLGVQPDESRLAEARIH